MNLQMLDIRQDSQLQSKVKALYRKAFPKEERIPWWLLALNSCREDIDLTAYLDGDMFCGFTSTVQVDGLYFVLFFAVEEALRQKGYGSAILSAIKAKYENVVLNIEPLDPEAANYPERQKRFAFYGKNGFVDTGYDVWEIGGKFRVLSTQAKLDVPLYKKVFRKLTFGLWNVKLQKSRS